VLSEPAASSAPIQMSSFRGVVCDAVFASGEYCAVLTADKQLFTWGRSLYGVASFLPGSL